MHDDALRPRPNLDHYNLLSPVLPSLPLGSHTSSTKSELTISGLKKREGKISLAYSPCRKAKKRCDGCRPCSTCQSVEKPGGCIFEYGSDRRKKDALRKTLESVRQERKHLQDTFNFLRDTNAESATVLHAKIRQGVTIEELIEWITQEKEVNAEKGAFCETEVVTASLPLHSPGVHELATFISSKEDWELAWPINATSIENEPYTIRPFPLAQEGIMPGLSTATDTTGNPKRTGRELPILWAAANGDEPLMAFLLENEDTNLAFTNFYNQTPLSLAAEQGHEGVVRLLFKRSDIEINYADLDGQTALAWAAFNGHTTIVQLLLERDDLEANSRDVDGDTPLSWAATNGHDVVVALLLQRYDVEISPVDNCGRTPLLLALRNGHECIVRMLALWDESPGL